MKIFPGIGQTFNGEWTLYGELVSDILGGEQFQELNDDSGRFGVLVGKRKYADGLDILYHRREGDFGWARASVVMPGARGKDNYGVVFSAFQFFNNYRDGDDNWLMDKLDAELKFAESRTRRDVRSEIAWMGVA